MICKYISKFCCEDAALIENYEEALADIETWDLHHRREIDENLRADELKQMGLYYNRPASELIFLTKSEHMSLHRRRKD